MFATFVMFLVAWLLQLHATATESQLPSNSSLVWKIHGPHGGGSQHLVAKARKTYRAVAPCLLGLEPGPSAANATFSAAIGLGKWKFPADAEEHYQDILTRTKSYR
eukprot:gene34774-44974_t